TYRPPAPYKYASVSSYYDQIRAGVSYLVKNEGAANICAMYIPSDFGQEIAEGAKDISSELGLNFASETTHRPDEQDFVGSLTKLRADGCDTIAIALGLRQVITAVATAKKIGWTDVSFMGSSAAFHTAVARVPGGVTEGMYASAGWSDIVARMDNPTLAEWVASFQEATGEVPPTGALLGRSAAELLVRALDAAGPDLTHDSFQSAVESLEYTDEILGVEVAYGPGDHQGADVIVISRIVDGNWIEVARQ
ncbi:MAG: ABC transporter substrate-binding protein, partial [Boseongicola sp.]|nr:ABC transporter substrate-binding protein [Boseongicola sp.]